MRILLYTPTFLPKVGGLELALDGLARALLARGHEVLVLAKEPKPPWRRPEPPYEVVYHRRTRSALALGPSARAMQKLHRQHNFDILHAHAIFPNGFVALRAGRKLGLPALITSHQSGIEPRLRHKRIVRWLSHWTLRHAPFVTAVSAELAGVLARLGGGRIGFLVIPNGVDLPNGGPPEAPARLSHLAGEPFILTLGRLHAVKGLDVLLRAVALLAEQGHAMPRVVLAGEGPMRQELTALAAGLGLGPRVEFVGLVMGPEKAWLLASAAFLAQPSRAEAMPMSVLEAMAYGRPVLVTRVGAMGQMVTDGLDGKVVEPESIEQLAQGLRWLLDPGRAAILSPAARRTAEAHAWPLVARRYEQLYQRVINSFGR